MFFWQTFDLVLNMKSNISKSMGHPDSYFSSLGQEELFYNRPHDNSNGLMPSYRTHPRMRTIDIPGKDTRMLG